MRTNYGPFRFGVAERGSVEACVICGKKPANEHSLRESANCDRIRYGYSKKTEEAA